MKFELIQELALPRETVWRAFENLSNLSRWQPTLISYEQVSGTPGQVGAVARLVYQEGGREVQLVETVTVRRAPEEFSGTYASDHGVTRLSNRFAESGAGRTRWQVLSEVQLTGMARFIGPMLRGLIEGRVRSDCDRFKSLLEAGELEV